MQKNDNHNTSAFRAYMEVPKHAIEAFNAAQEGELSPDTPVEYIDLEGIPYMDTNENVACLAGDRLIVLTKQKDANYANLPLRLLLCVGRLYGKLLDRKVYYGGFTMLPTPVFIACCGSDVPLPQGCQAKLSSAVIGDSSAVELCVSFIRVDYDTDKDTKV